MSTDNLKRHIKMNSLNDSNNKDKNKLACSTQTYLEILSAVYIHLLVHPIIPMVSSYSKYPSIVFILRWLEHIGHDKHVKISYAVTIHVHPELKTPIERWVDFEDVAYQPCFII